MAYWINESLKKKESEKDLDNIINLFKEDLSVPGNLINSIIDWVNKIKKQNDEESEEETFGYGRFDFEKIVSTAKHNPDAFKNIKY
jgi:hypothetical protein